SMDNSPAEITYVDASKSDDLPWAERSNYWLQFTPGKYHKRVPKPDYRQPIILAGHGVRISVDKGALLIRNGFTHYPQRRETWRIFHGGWRLHRASSLLT